LGRRLCYTKTIAPADLNQHEVRRNLHLLSAWGVPPPSSLALEIHPDPALQSIAEKFLPEPAIICHLGTGQPKKEWPLRHWAELFQKASAAGLKLVFSTGPGGREQALLAEFRTLAPAAPVLAAVPNLAVFLAILSRAQLFISGDTGPLHFAAGLGVPTISLFGATSATLWAPLGERHQVLQGSRCSCDGHTGVCLAAQHCLAAISPDTVLNRIEQVHRG
jgi:ADP-heptose:LPS heptosyltransferase